MRIGLIGCVKAKQTTPTAAADLYTSALFAGRKAAVQATCDRFHILSALHGLIDPDRVIAPYDVTLTGMPIAARRDWASRTLAVFLTRYPGPPGTVEIHAGADYRDHGLADGLIAAGWEIHNPVAGLGIGQQLGYYAASASA